MMLCLPCKRLIRYCEARLISDSLGKSVFASTPILSVLCYAMDMSGTVRHD